MIELALRSMDAALEVRDGWLIAIGLVTGVVWWLVDEVGRRVRDRGGRRGR